MKYILLILGIFMAFNPSGICMDNNCCSDKAVIEVEQNKNCEASKCCDHEEEQAVEGNEDSEQLPQHVQSNHCDCCAITFVINIRSAEQSGESISSIIHTKAKKLLSRYSFSIWIPPNNVV